jgi:hypothetical protein
VRSSPSPSNRHESDPARCCDAHPQPALSPPDWRPFLDHRSGVQTGSRCHECLATSQSCSSSSPGTRPFATRAPAR